MARKRQGESRPRLQLRPAAARAVLAGHPWVWDDGLVEAPGFLQAGDEVLLIDGVGGCIARALAEGPHKEGSPALRIFSTDERDPPLRKLLFRRLNVALRLRAQLLPPKTTGFRWIHGEGDHLPGLVVDRYEGVLVVRPDSQAWKPHMPQVVDALQSECGGGLQSILLKERGSAEAEHLAGSKAPEVLVFKEEGRRYRVRPGRGQKTGFFLDQRPNRSRVQRWSAQGPRVLNLFSYTGGFSLAAALGGAKEVTSVDLNPSILSDCEAQFSLNGVAQELHRSVALDLFRDLGSWAKGEQSRYDLVICDPPALAKKKKDLERARAAYQRLHTGLAGTVKPGGLLLTASCTARLGPKELLDDAKEGLRKGNRRVQRVMGTYGAGIDHPIPPAFTQGRYLTAILLALD